MLLDTIFRMMKFEILRDYFKKYFAQINLVQYKCGIIRRRRMDPEEMASNEKSTIEIVDLFS
jgi:hypothetical protein